LGRGESSAAAAIRSEASNRREQKLIEFCVGNLALRRKKTLTAGKYKSRVPDMNYNPSRVKYVCDYSFAAFLEIEKNGLPVSHVGSLWIQFFCTPDEAAALSFKCSPDKLN
jgi:hypothetical protein